MKLLKVFVAMSGFAWAGPQGSLRIEDMWLPSPHLLAPGQISTLFVTGLTEVTESRSDGVASFELGGLQMFLNAGPSRDLIPVALFEVAPALPCGFRASGELCQKPITGIVFQTPPELRVPLFGGPPRVSSPTLIVMQGGAVRAEVDYTPVYGNVVVWKRGGTLERLWPSGGPSHADGRPVTASDPARPGEPIEVLLTGVQGPIGEAGRPQPEDYTVSLAASSTFGPGAIPPAIGPERVLVRPLPGHAGLWIARLVIPDQLPTGLANCGQQVSHNYAVSLGYLWLGKNWDTVTLCVALP